MPISDKEREGAGTVDAEGGGGPWVERIERRIEAGPERPDLKSKNPVSEGVKRGQEPPLVSATGQTISVRVKLNFIWGEGAAREVFTCFLVL